MASLDAVVNGVEELVEFTTKLADGTSTISTEQAVTVFALGSGLGGAISQIFAANRLGEIESNRIPTVMIAPALIMSAGATIVAGAALTPTSANFFHPSSFGS